MATQTAPVTFQYSHTIGRQELRGGNGFFLPVAVARDTGERLYVLSRGTDAPALTPCRRVTICDVDETYVGQFGYKMTPEEAGPDAPNESLMWPTSVALDAQGRAYVADEWINRISVFTKDGDWIGKWGTTGAEPGQLNRPSGLACDADDNLYVVDSRNHRIQVFRPDGTFVRTWGSHGSGPGQLNVPWGITLDQHGDVYVADWRNDRIQKFTAQGAFLMQFGSSGAADGQFDRPTSVAVDRDGLIYVTDYRNDRLQVFDAEGNFLTKLLGEATLSKWGMERIMNDPIMMRGRERAQSLEACEKPFQGPIAVTVDAQDRVFVAEAARHRVQVFRKQSAFFAGGPL